MTAPASAPQQRTYGNWRVPSSPGIGSLGLLPVMLLFFGLIILLLLMILAPLPVALVWLGLVLLAIPPLVFKNRHGLTPLQRWATRLAWRRARRTGANVYRSGPTGRTGWGRFQLPGVAARSELSEAADSYGRRFALLHYPSTNHYTVVFACEPDGASLVDQNQVDHWVASWGNWLGQLGAEPGLIAASVTVETAPDTGARLRREVASNLVTAAPEVARRMYEEIVATYPVGSASVAAWVALTFRATSRNGRRRDRGEMARDLASRLPGLTSGLSAAGAGAARPVTAQELCEVIRSAYDPAAAGLIEEAHAQGHVPELNWEDVGPTAHETRWDSYRHEGAWSVTWAMTNAPRGEVFSDVLANLLAPHGDVDRKRVTLLYRPLDPASSAAAADQAIRAERTRQGDRPTAPQLASLRAAERTAQDEARGHPMLDFGLLVTATVTDQERLPDARATVEMLTASARLLVRPVLGSQDSAFAASLPLGIVIPEHLVLPDALRRALL